MYNSKYFSGKFAKNTPYARFKSKVFADLDVKRRLDFIGEIYSISGISQAFPCEVSLTSGHSLITGDRVYLKDIEGMTELNGKEYIITVTDADKFTLDEIDSTNYTAYDTGGKAVRLETAGDSEIQAVTIVNNGTATIYLAESEGNVDTDKAGIIIKPNGTYDEYVSNLSKFWLNKSETGTIDVRVFIKKYGEGV